MARWTFTAKFDKFDLGRAMPKSIEMGIFAGKPLNGWHKGMRVIGGQFKIRVNPTGFIMQDETGADIIVRNQKEEATTADTFKKTMIDTGLFAKGFTKARNDSQIAAVILYAIDTGDERKMNNSATAAAKQAYYVASKLRRNSRYWAEQKGFNSWGINTGTTFKAVKGVVHR